MKIIDILISRTAGANMQPLDKAELLKGKGIVGDRYFNKTGTFSEALIEKGDFEVTLISQKEIDAFNKSSGLGYSALDFCRNIVISGADLNALEGKEFSLGSVILRCTRLCEPCAHLASLLDQQIMKKMVHKAGLRAVILRSGSVKIGDTIQPC